MTTDRNAVRAGLFILVTIALIVGVVISIKGLGRLVEPRQTLTAAFKLSDDLGGLKVGDDIRIGGAKVGEVKEIAIDAAAEQIKVKFALPRSYTVHQDAHLGVQQTVTGTSWLNFQSLGKGAPASPDQPIAGRPSSMTQLLASLGDAAPELQQVLVDVRTKTLPRVNTTVDKVGDTAVSFKTTGDNATVLLKHVDEKIDPIVHQYNNVTGTATGALAQIRDTFGESKLDWKGTLANLNQTTGSIKERLPKILDQVQVIMEKADTGVTKASSALDDIRTTMANARDVSATARSVITGNRSKLDSMVSSLKATGDNLKAASTEIRHSPWRLLYKPGPNEIANLNLYDSARQFAEGANDLSDAAAALRDSLKDPNTDKHQVESLVEKLDTSFQNFNDVEKKLWDKVK
jgi:phospholipid/cholesterol/gamma-HCH transport system substrate-binding protein